MFVRASVRRQSCLHEKCADTQLGTGHILDTGHRKGSLLGAQD